MIGDSAEKQPFSGKIDLIYIKWHFISLFHMTESSNEDGVEDPGCVMLSGKLIDLQPMTENLTLVGEMLQV